MTNVLAVYSKTIHGKCLDTYRSRVIIGSPCEAIQRSRMLLHAHHILPHIVQKLLWPDGEVLWKPPAAIQGQKRIFRSMRELLKTAVKTLRRD